MTEECGISNGGQCERNTQINHINELPRESKIGLSIGSDLKKASQTRSKMNCVTKDG